MTSTLLYLPLLLTGPTHPLTPVTIFGFTAYASGMKYDVSLAGGLEARGQVAVFGGSGEIGLATGLTAPRHVDVTLKDVDAAQVAALAGDGIPDLLRDRLKGKIGKVALTVRGDAVAFKAEKFRLAGEWVTRAEGTADLKTRKYKLKVWAFGGLMEMEGALPKDLDTKSESLAGGK